MEKPQDTPSDLPTFEELRVEAMRTVYKLAALNDGRCTPEEILHLGIFFGSLSKHLEAMKK